MRALFPARPAPASPPPADPAPPEPPAELPAEPAAATGRRRLGWVVAAGIVLGVAAGVAGVTAIRGHGAVPGEPLAAQGGAAPGPEPGGDAGLRPLSWSPAVPASSAVSAGVSAKAGAASDAAVPVRGRSAPATAATTTGPADASTTAAATAAAGPLTGYSACTSGSSALFAATFTVTFSWHHVFIDTDQDTATGYRVPQVAVGADYMVEEGTLYRSTGSRWGWTEVAGVSPLVSRADGTYRWRVPLAAVGGSGGSMRSVFNGSGASPDAYSPVLTVAAC